MPDLVSEVDSDRRAARASRAWPLPGSGANPDSAGARSRARAAIVAVHHMRCGVVWVWYGDS